MEPLTMSTIENPADKVATMEATKKFLVLLQQEFDWTNSDVRQVCEDAIVTANEVTQPSRSEPGTIERDPYEGSSVETTGGGSFDSGATNERSS